MSSASGPYADEREKWRNFARVRPPNIVVSPRPGQESVWDYPRPPRVEPVAHRIRVKFGGIALAESGQAVRVCEMSSPPVYYVPPADVRMELLVGTERTSFCEWKGVARYWAVQPARESPRTPPGAIPIPTRGTKRSGTSWPSTLGGWMPAMWGKIASRRSQAFTTAAG